MSFVRAAALAAICCSIASTAAAAERQRIDIPAGRLGDSLAALGRQAGVSVGISDPSLALRPAPAVRGQMTARDALRRLVGGLGASVVTIDEATFRIVPAPRTMARRPSRREQPIARVVRTAPLPESQPEHVVVIGSRRSAPMADYAGSVTIVDGSDPAFTIAPRGTEALVGRLAEMTSTHLGPGRNKIFIRGVSESSFNGPTQATVGQYLDEFRVNYNAPDPDLRLYDLARIEVLEGPQGTLYGAGALGGIVRVMPAGPNVERTEAHVSVGASSTSSGGTGGDLSAMLNLPLVPSTAALRLTAYAVSDAGYIDDLERGKSDVNRVRAYGGRLAARAALDDAWTLDALLVGQRIRGDDAQYAEVDLPRLTRRSALAQRHSNDYSLAGISARRNGEYRDVVLSLSYVDQKLFERYDAVAVGNPLVAYDLTTDVRLFSAEARVSGRQDNGGSWVLGTALYANSSDQDRDVEFFVARERRNQVSNRLTEAALYGEAQFPIAPRVDLTLGGRFSAAWLASEGFLFTPGAPLPDQQTRVETSAYRLLPSAAISARPTDDLFLFGRYQESFRPGGLSVGANGIGRFDSDRLRSIEIGARRGRRGAVFQANLTAGLIRWTDVQADTLDQFAEPATINIGDARNLFVDAGVEWRPLDGLRVEAGAVLIDSKITSGPAQGLALPGVARFNGRLGAHYTTALANGASLQLGGTARYTGTSYLDTARDIPPDFQDFLRRKQGGWVDVGLSAQLDFGRYALTILATNLLNSAANRFALGTPLLLAEREFTTPVRPRTIRLGWRLRY